jgi:hypothetical protein
MINQLLIDVPRALDIQKDGLTSHYHFELSLDTAWIAGLVGSIELKPRPANTLLVTLCCDAPNEVVATRKPACGLTEEDARISATIEEEATNEARAILACGVRMAVTTVPTDSFKKCTAVWDKEANDYWIESAVTSAASLAPPHQLWEDENLYLKLSVPLHLPLDGAFSLNTALSTHGVGIQVGAFESLKELVGDDSWSPQPLLDRVMYYLHTFGTTIALHKIAREGDSVHLSVNAIDAAVYPWLLKFSVLFPGALRPAAHRLNTFVVPSGPLMWHVVARLRGMVREKHYKPQAGIGQGVAIAATAGVPQGWNVHQLRSNRVPWLHQTEAVAEMVRKHDAGRRGHYLHAPLVELFRLFGVRALGCIY